MNTDSHLLRSSSFSVANSLALVALLTAYDHCFSTAHAQAAYSTNWNSLTNWTQSSAPTTNWQCIASSADGTKLAARVYTFPWGNLHFHKFWRCLDSNQRTNHKLALHRFVN